MSPSVDRLARLRELATADVSILLGEPLGERETRIVLHVVELMHAVAHNVERENARLAEAVRALEADCAGRGDGPQMGVVA